MKSNFVRLLWRGIFRRMVDSHLLPMEGEPREETGVENEQKVYGIVYDPKATSDDTHAHEIFIVTWDGKILHTHGFEGLTSFNVGHRHFYAGITQPEPSGVPHTHLYSTVTSFNDGHTHRLSGRTGPANPLPGGGHYHFFEGVTTIDGRTPHTHAYSGSTGNELPA